MKNDFVVSETNSKSSRYLSDQIVDDVDPKQVI